MKKKKGEAKREAILDAALEEFAERGYACARMEDIARRAGVAKGTLYLHFGDKEGLFNGLAESALGPLREVAGEIIGDDSLSLRGKLERLCDPLIADDGCSRTARIVRLVWAEGLHNPKLVTTFYHSLVAPLLELHRENVRRATHEAPPAALQRFPQLMVSPIMQGLLWQGLFKDTAPLDVAGLYRAYLDMILPEKAPSSHTPARGPDAGDAHAPPGMASGPGREGDVPAGLKAFLEGWGEEG